MGLGRLGAPPLFAPKRSKWRHCCDAHLRPGLEKVLGVQTVDLDTLLAESDVVSLHTPLTDETRNMIDARALALMKPMAILINTARGAVVDIDSLAAALREGRLAGAGIDVLPGEPPQPDTPLIRLWQANDSPLNLIITPHTAFVSNEGMIEMREKAAREIRRALRDERLLNCVNTEYLKKRS